MEKTKQKKEARWQGNRWHLTYKGHLPLDRLLGFLQEKGLITMHSIVHEAGSGTQSKAAVPSGTPSSMNERANTNVQCLNSQESTAARSQTPTSDVEDAEELLERSSKNLKSGAKASPPNSTGMDQPAMASQQSNAEVPEEILFYEHTHALVQYSSRLRGTGSRFWDFNGVHPHVRKVTGANYFKNAWLYHEKDPIKRIRSLKQPLADNKQMEMIKKAATLADACLAMDIQPKSVTDINLLRQVRDPLNLGIPEIKQFGSWNLSFCLEPCILLTGPSGIGKTRWALAHFQNPLLVCHLSDLKRLTEEHDGLVFDDYNFNKLSLEECIHLVDIEMPRTINVKHGAVTIPANTPRIFTTNSSFEDLFPTDTHGAIKRRMHVLKVFHKLFDDYVEEPLFPLEKQSQQDYIEEFCNMTPPLPLSGCEEAQPEWMMAQDVDAAYSEWWSSKMRTEDDIADDAQK